MSTDSVTDLPPAGANDRIDNPGHWLAQTTRSRLDDQAFVVVSGAEAHKFLQGQLTCHLDEVTATHSVCGSYCTVQGRMITSFRIAQRGDGALLLRMHASVVDATVQTLKKYGVFSKVQIAAEHEYVALAVEGPDSHALVTAIAPGLGSGRNAACCDESLIAIQTDDGAQRFELWASASRADDIWHRLDAATTASTTLWRLRNIRDGLGHVEAASQDMFIPQMLNFQLTGFVHFKKGCYTGQEIVARMQYLGKLKRHMYRFDVHGDTAPVAGEDLKTAQSTQSVGNIVSVVSFGDGHHEVLAVVTDEARDSDSLHTAGNATARFRRLELPYAITVGSEKNERRKP